MMGEIVRWPCPRRCGFYREWHESWDYLGNVIDHPVYGKITGSDLVYYDIVTHDCRAYWLAIMRLRQRR